MILLHPLVLHVATPNTGKAPLHVTSLMAGDAHDTGSVLLPVKLHEQCCWQIVDMTRTESGAVS